MADKDDEQRLLQERRELLKLKQGIIEESGTSRRKYSGRQELRLSRTFFITISGMWF